MQRRQLLKLLGTVPVAAQAGRFAFAESAPAGKPMRFPKPIGSPVLESIRPVIENSRYVHTSIPRIVEVASWMGYEELPMPEYALPLGVGKEAAEGIDFMMVSDCIDFAFTDFHTHVKFQVNYAGQHWSDSDAMFACLKRAQDEGIPVTHGAYMAKVTRADLEHIFRGNIRMPMLDERVKILNSVGKVLDAQYGGHFYNFVKACSPRVYDHGHGLVDKLVAEFPRFNDIYQFQGHEIKIYKLAQLGVWMMYAVLHRSGGFKLEDPEKLTAFADYILPAALRILRIFHYAPELEHAIDHYQMIPAGSRQEIELRCHTLYATALLREEINKLRPANLQIIIPQVDARLWTHYHTTFWPHHLTRTIMY